MITLKEEQAEYARRLEARESYERAKDTISEVKIEAAEIISGLIDPMESFSPSWIYDEYRYRIKPEPLEFWVNVNRRMLGGSVYASKEEAELGKHPGWETIKGREVL